MRSPLQALFTPTISIHRFSKILPSFQLYLSTPLEKVLVVVPRVLQCTLCYRILHRALTTGSYEPKLSPVFKMAAHWPDRIAIADQHGEYTYRSIFNASKSLAKRIDDTLGDKIQQRVAFLCPNNVTYVVTQWACFMSGHIAVPLSPSHPEEMLQYFITDSDSGLLITTTEFEDKFKRISEKTGKPLNIVLGDEVKNLAIKSNDSDVVDTELNKQNLPVLKAGLNPNMYSKLNAMILYTSGSTAMPKGVVISHSNLVSQINSMLNSWGWSNKDTILHTLPLHHTHGIVNGLMTPLYCGARCIMLKKFDAAKVWNQLLAVKVGSSKRVTVFTGVPTMYVKLIEEYDKSLSKNERMINYVKSTCSQKIRLMMCGSASLPESVFSQWERITGHRLLERYGMTEVGMALSNPLRGERKPGFVGNPMPGVNVRITDGSNVLVEGNEYCTKIMHKDSSPKESKFIGELLIKGDSVFKEYWGKSEVTKHEFTSDGWFKTGDTAQYIDASYRIMGRTSVDIIKSGGYKISALFVETILLQHPDINDVAVVGLPDQTWGQQITAIVVPHIGKQVTLADLKQWCKDKSPSYAIPSSLKIVQQIPRNLMGKVNKKELIRELFPDIYKL